MALPKPPDDFELPELEIDDNNNSDNEHLTANVEKTLPPDNNTKWKIDPKTGKKYELLGTSDPEWIKTYIKTKGKGGPGISDFTKAAENSDFNADDLNGEAERFMAHLRVPITKEERAQIIAERKKILEEQEKARQKEIIEEEIEDEKEKRDSEDFLNKKMKKLK